MQTFLIIVAGGTGSRIGSEIPKQFLEIGGKPVIYYSIEQFIKADREIKIVVVVHAAWKNQLNEIVKKYFPAKDITITEGGETRFHSVKNGLEKITGDGIVCIHDAARPLVSTETISRCIEEVKRKGNATPVIPVTESLRKITDGNSHSVNRNDFRIVQTPQCFSVTEIKKAFLQEYDSSFTDDATVFEKAGNKINLVAGNPENIKITFPSDLHYAEYILNRN